MNDLQNINNKTIALATLFSLLLFQPAAACDLCGCTTSSGASAFGDLSMSNFLGLRYMYQGFESRDGIFANSPTSEEHFNTYQLWGRVPICKNVYLSAVVPVQDLRRKFDDREEHLHGLGDITLMGWYQFNLYKKKKNDGPLDVMLERKRSNHSLQWGLGVKLPTGEFEQRLTDVVNPGFQVGTGSYDIFSSLVYGYKKKNLGVAATVAYYHKTENKNEYRFGNQFSYSSTIFYDIGFKETVIKPFVGLSGDAYGSIEQFGESLPATDGSILNSSIGSEIGHKKFLLGIKYTLPVTQDLFGGNVQSQNQFSLYLNYSI